MIRLMRVYRGLGKVEFHSRLPLFSLPAAFELIKREHMIVVHTGIRHNVDEKQFEANSPATEPGRESPIKIVSLIGQHDIESQAVAFQLLYVTLSRYCWNVKGVFSCLNFLRRFLGRRDSNS
jgi:hypothetical protein